MPQVNLTPETYETLSKLAAERGCSPDALAESLVIQRSLKPPMTDTEWRAEWAASRSKMQASLPPGITDEEVEADIKAARQEYWDERQRAGSR